MPETAKRKALGLEDKIVREGRVIQARVMNEARKPTAPEQHNLLQMAIARVKAKQMLAKLIAEPMVNRDTHHIYKPHTEFEAMYVYSDTPRYLYVKGGEGSGKSTFGTIKTIHKARRGMSGIVGSSDFEHLKKSLWAEFRRWVNPDWLVEKDRYRLSPVWEPAKQFELHFNTIYGNIATLYCGGFDDPTGWEGPNVNFAHFDEPRRHKEPDMLKVLDGRVRIPGPQMEPPQIYLTGTPAKHWLWEYFGNIECKCLNCETEFSDTGALDKDTFKRGVCPVCGM